MKQDKWHQVEQSFTRGPLYFLRSTLGLLIRVGRIQIKLEFLGIYEFPNFVQECADAFDGFIKEHSDWNGNQVLFARTVKDTIAKRGKVELSELYEDPFSRIGTPNKLFNEDDIEDIMMVCKTLENRYNAIS